MSISCKLQLVNKLKANFLVENIMVYIEKYIINFSSFFALIYSCGIRIDINAKQYSKFLKHRVQMNASIIISPCLEALHIF